MMDSTLLSDNTCSTIISQFYFHRDNYQSRKSTSNGNYPPNPPQLPPQYILTNDPNPPNLQGDPSLGAPHFVAGPADPQNMQGNKTPSYIYTQIRLPDL